jgi:[NiFe]-hydrogenase assembly, chaperone, HybE
MDRLAEIVADVRAAFERVHREQFLGDPAANPRLAVAVLDPAVVADTPVVVLLTPWTVNGLAFPPDDEFPAELEIAGRRRPVFRVEVPELGAFRSVNLPPEPSSLSSLAQARGLARSWAGPFQAAVAAARVGRAADGTAPGQQAAAARPERR